MKTILFVFISILALFIFNLTNAQNVAVTDDNLYNAHGSAMLDIKSDNKGFLVPRLTTVQMNAILEPVTGLLIFNTELNVFCYYEGSRWINLSTQTIASATSVGDPLFKVVNANGDTVFAVYPEGVRINVGDGQAKGTGNKGGFAVGGFTTGKAAGKEFLRVTSDSVRVYIDTTGTKGTGNKSGFAVGGFTTGKGMAKDLLRVSHDSVRIYIDESQGKGTGNKGGFAVGGYTTGKQLMNNYFNVSPNNNLLITESDPRILFYPVKNAFLVGQVLAESPDSIGINSSSLGFETKAIGQFSQAMGYQSVSRGNFSTSIGKNAYAKSENSFAFGDSASAIGMDSYAFGTGASAFANGSFAFGSVGRDTLGNSTGNYTSATGLFSIAMGLGALSSGKGAITMGINAVASGDYSLSAGLFTTANSFAMTALGRYNYINESYNKTEWVNTDPLFVVGNGFNNLGSNALTLTKNGKLGILVNAPEYDLQFNTERFYKRQVGISRPSLYSPPFVSGKGTSLYISAGGCSDFLTATDVDGGSLHLKSGISRGTGKSSIIFYTVFPVESGITTDNEPSQRMVITGTGVAINTPNQLNTLDVAGNMVVGGNYAGTVSAPVHGMIVQGTVGIGKGNPSSKLDVNGSMALPIITISTGITLDNSHYTVLVNNKTSVEDINLPMASSCTGRIYIIKRIAAYNVNIVPYSGEKIDGATSLTLSTQWERIVIQSNGTNWFAIY